MELEKVLESSYAFVAEYVSVTLFGGFRWASSRDLVQQFDDEGYRPTQRELLTMRRKGIIPWSRITDGSRLVFRHGRYGSPECYAKKVALTYRRDYWYDSDEYAEAWLEKKTLRGVILPTVSEEYGAHLYATKEQTYATQSYEAAEHIGYDVRPRHLRVLSEHDPKGSGIFYRVGPKPRLRRRRGRSLRRARGHDVAVVRTGREEGELLKRVRNSKLGLMDLKAMVFTPGPLVTPPRVPEGFERAVKPRKKGACS